MARPSKLTPDIQKRIGENIALGLTYRLAAQSVGITYKTLNEWNQRGQTEKSGKYFEFSQHIQKSNADAAKALLERLNEAVKAGNCTVCMWILSRRFHEDFGRRQYRKMDIVSENKNENVEILVKDTDTIRNEILNKLSMIGEL